MDKVEVMRSFVKGCEALAALTGFLCWQKWRKSFWIAFPFYLLFIVLVENLGKFIAENISHQANNYFHYFFSRPVTFMFFYWVFYQYDRSVHRNNKIILPIAVVYLIGVIIDYLYIRYEIMWRQSFSFSVGTILMLILLIRFFIYFVFNAAILDYHRSMMIWVSLGLFLYYVGIFPFFTFRNELFDKLPDLFYTYWYIQMSLSGLMYLLFSFSFIWAKPKS